MKILGFINAFDELSEPDRRLGRKVANFGVVTALLEHSSFDELHFFLPFQGALAPFQRVYAPWLERPELAGRVKLLPALALPSSLERTAYTALHAPELDRYLPELCHLRNRVARHPTPITCITHTLSYWPTQVRNLYKVLPGAMPYDAVICTSRAAREHLSRAFAASTLRLRALGLNGAGFAGRLEIAPLGVRLSDFPLLDQAEARARLGLGGDEFTLLSLGRLSPADKCDLAPLIGALALLIERGVPARLILAGGGGAGYGQALLEQARRLGLEGRVSLSVDFDSEIKPTLLAAADVVVAVTDNLQETFGLSIIEAMAAARPVVASDFSGYRDLVVEGRTGFLVPTLGPASFEPLDAAWTILPEHIAALQVAQRTAVDLDVLVERLLRLAGDPGLRQGLGRTARQRAAERFEWGRVVPRLEEIWLRLRAQAQALGRPARLMDVLAAGQGELFGHFPSRAIADDLLLSPGPLAARRAAGDWAQAPYPDAAATLPPAELDRVLEALAARGQRASLAELQADLAPQMPAYQCEHLVLWGLKYGLLSRQG
ncbi:MAG: glycosyltransferase family 4 protein [Desulfarculus sp.]|nr:glycosyltransferase family 4 protein [Desulfarculus sp.]